MAEGRNVRPLGRIHIHRQQVFTSEINMRREVKGERRVASLVLAQPLSVDPHGGSGHDAFKVHEDAVAARLGRKLGPAAVTGDELVAFFVKAVPGQANIGVRNHDALISGVVEIARVHSFHDCAAISPVPVQGQNQSSLGSHWLGGAVGEGGASNRRARDESAGGLEKVASVHGSPIVVSRGGGSRAALSNIDPISVNAYNASPCGPEKARSEAWAGNRDSFARQSLLE